MKILFIGRGVIATTYGWAMAQAGHQVAHLVRPGKTDALAAPLALDLWDCRKPVARQRAKAPVLSGYQAACIETLADLAGFDLVVASVRHDQTRAVVAQLAAAPRPRLGCLFFNNCWEDPDEVTAPLPAEARLWGFPLAGGGYTADGSLIASLLPDIHLAEATTANAALRDAVAGLFTGCGFSITGHADMRAWLWRHFAVNAGLVARAIQAGTDASGLLVSHRQVAEALELAREAVRVAEARLTNPQSERGESRVAALPIWLGSLLFRLVARQPAIHRVMSAHANPAELARFPLDVLAEARARGLDCPRLAAVEAAARRISGQGIVGTLAPAGLRV